MMTPEMINDMLAAHWPASRCVCMEVGPAHAMASLTPEDADIRPGGYIAGPTLFSAADAALWFLCFGAADRIEPLALTSDLAIRFLRPARGKTVFARADLNKAGGRSVIGSVTIWTDIVEAPCAIAQGTYILP
jgi:acyl-coenzyme A thioesterase PaaI-like protein